jgi:hypothetical protein
MENKLMLNNFSFTFTARMFEDNAGDTRNQIILQMNKRNNLDLKFLLGSLDPMCAIGNPDIIHGT